MILKKLTPFLLFALTTTAFASGEKQTTPAAVSGCNAALEDFAKEVEEMLKNYRTNLSVRGFANSRFQKNAHNAEIAEKYGFLWWYTQGYFVKSKEEALEHAKQFSRSVQDRFGVGLYFIADESELGIEHTSTGKLVPAANLEKIFSRGAIEIEYLDHDTGKAIEEVDPRTKELVAKPMIREISGQNLLSRINLANQEDQKMGVTYVTGHDRSFNSNYININGWHTGKFLGIIDHKKFLESTQFAQLSELYRKLYSAGFRMQFKPDNQAIVEDAFNVLINTARKKRVKDANGKTVEKYLPLDINRHRLVGVDHLKTKDAYVAPLVNPQGEVVGGEAGMIKNMEGETIFYSEERGEKAGLPELTTASKLSTALVVQMAVRQGLMFSSSGPMVSNFSASTQTKVTPLPQALQILSSTVQDRSKLLSNYTWNPYEGEEAKKALVKQLSEVARKQQVSLGQSKFLSAYPAMNEITVQIADEQGLMPTVLNFQIVDSYLTAKTIAEKQADGALNTIFVIMDKSLVSRMTANEALNAIFSSRLPEISAQKQQQANTLGPVQGLISFKKPGAKDIRYYDKGLIVPRLHLSQFSPVTWLNPKDPQPVLSVPGWAPKTP